MTRLHPLLTEKPAIAPPVFVFQKDKALKVRYTKMGWWLKKNACIFLLECDVLFIYNRMH